MRSTTKTLFILLAIFFYNEMALSQLISSAVMDVQVEVVSGSRIDMNHGYYSIKAEKKDSMDLFEIEYGNFTVSIPAESEIIVESNSEVEMSDRTSSWTMNSEVTHSLLDDYSLQLIFTGTSGDDQVANGHYRGTQVATIQYL